MSTIEMRNSAIIFEPKCRNGMTLSPNRTEYCHINPSDAGDHPAVNLGMVSRVTLREKTELLQGKIGDL